MPRYGYQYGQSGGLQSIRQVGPYRSIFPSSGSLLLELLRQKKAQDLLDAEERKRGREIADQAWKDAVKYNPDPARSEYKEYFQKQTENLMDTASKARRTGGGVDDVYRHIASIQSDDTKVSRFDKEASALYSKLEKSGVRNMNVIDDMMARSVYDDQLSGQLGVKVVKPPKDLNIDELRSGLENNIESYSPSKLTETFVKNVIEPSMTEEINDKTGPFGSIIRTVTGALPKSMTSGFLPSGKPRIVVGDPGSPNSNKLLAQWDALSPDHAKYLDLAVQRANPDLNLEAASKQDLGILRQVELQKILDTNGHIDPKAPRQTVFHDNRPDGLAALTAAEKKELFNEKAKVIHTLFTGNLADANRALANLNSADGTQKSVLDPLTNTITVTRQKAAEYNPATGKTEIVPASTVVIDLNDHKKAIPLLNDAWQRVSPVKGEVDTQALMKELYEKMDLANPDKLRKQPLTGPPAPRETKVPPPPGAAPVTQETFAQKWAKLKSGETLVGPDGKTYKKK